ATGAAGQAEAQVRAPAPTKLSEELRALCRQHLAAYEVPSSIEFVKELPRSPLGKLLKRELRKAPAVDPARASPAAISASAQGAEDDDNSPRPTPANGKNTNGKKSEKPEKEAA